MDNLIQKNEIYGFKRFFLFIILGIKYKVLSQFIGGSYSQRGEDIIIDKLLGYKKSGFYVDVGANDPSWFSNTKRFYKKGWRGINIEPNPNNYKKFENLRKNDINLGIGISIKSAILKFYRFIPDTLSTFSAEEAEKYKKGGFKLIDTLNIRTKKLAEVLDEFCDSPIDFISIDTEGLDLEVLQSNNWSKFRPKIICIESKKGVWGSFCGECNNEQEDFLLKKGYSKHYDNGLNSIYLLNE